jgi:hypothetical protein
MVSKSYLNKSVVVISIIIALLTIFTFYSDYKISQYESTLNDLLVKQNNRLQQFIRVEVQLSTYLNIINFPQDYDIYGGAEAIKSNVSNLNSQQNSLVSEEKDLVNQINTLKSNKPSWYWIRDLIYFVNLLLALINTIIGLIIITKKNR